MIKFRKIKFWIFVALPYLLCGESIQLINDSVYPLIAQIYNANGELQGAVNVSPGYIHMWYRPVTPFSPQPNRPTTPYQVRWLCKPCKAESLKGRAEIFGTWTQVPLPSTITAMGSPAGPRTCTCKYKKKQTTEIPIRKQQNYAIDTWSNDGGQTWTNDAGPGWEDWEPEEEVTIDN